MNTLKLYVWMCIYLLGERCSVSHPSRITTVTFIGSNSTKAAKATPVVVVYPTRYVSVVCIGWAQCELTRPHRWTHSPQYNNTVCAIFV